MKSMTSEARLSRGGEQRRACLVKWGAAGVSALLAVRPGLAAGTASPEASSAAHFPFGPVVPARSIPAWRIATHLGQSTDLAALLRGRTTAVQLMFTGCSATCPIQGAVFAQVQQSLGRASPSGFDPQLVSISIDPLSDSPAALAAWLGKFGATAGWSAVVPRIDDVSRVFELFGRDGERRPGGSDPHTGQVYIVNRQGQLIYRLPSQPSAAQIVKVMQAVAAQA